MQKVHAQDLPFVPPRVLDGLSGGRGFFSFFINAPIRSHVCSFAVLSLWMIEGGWAVALGAAGGTTGAPLGVWWISWWGWRSRSGWRERCRWDMVKCGGKKSD